MANGQWRGIPEPRLPSQDQPLRFSFKHLHLEHEKFNVRDCDQEFILAFIRAIREFSTWTIESFTYQKNNFHRHSFDFANSSEPDGFLSAPHIDAEQLGSHEAWQYAVPCERSDVRGRVHGILIDDTFYVVWLDPLHKLFG